MPQTLLEIKNLRINFLSDEEWHEVVHGIDFEVHKGRTLGIVGESGSGKSVSNLSVMHLLNPKVSKVKADSVLLDGLDIKDFNEKPPANSRSFLFLPPSLLSDRRPAFSASHSVNGDSHLSFFFHPLLIMKER